ncbi:MAG: hypothetical protein K0R05_4413 [Anaerocolumna sp.]|nr:hypothetical protein [Anaerocolumna sp.]
MIKTFNEYLQALEIAIVRNGKKSLSDSQIYSFISSNHLDSDWQIVASDVRKDIMPIVKRYDQQNQSNVAQPKQPYKRVDFSTPNNGKKIKTYSEYLRVLENTIVSNGKKCLNDAKIQFFISSNRLDSDWQISSVEVKKDMMSIVKKYEQIVQNNTIGQKPIYQRGVSCTSNGGKKVKSYDEYMKLLEVAMINNGKHELSDAQINSFLVSYCLNTEWGISTSEVKTDMSTITAKFARQARSSALKVKYAGQLAGQENPDISKNISGIDGDINKKVKTEKAMRQLSGLTEEDKQLAVSIKEALLLYPDLLNDRRRLRGALADLIPGKKMEVNLLSELVEENIVAEIKAVVMLDSVMCDRYASVLENNFGTSTDVAKRMVLIWFHGYGRLVLGKTISIL